MTAEELKTWRKQQGLSQESLAQLLGVDHMTISRYERQLRAIPPFLHLALRYLETQLSAAVNPSPTSATSSSESR